MSKKLYRSRDNRLVAGVCAGVAEYFGHDATIWRLLFVFFLVLTGLMPGLLLYVLAWLIVPVRPKNEYREVEYEVKGKKAG